MVAVLGLAPAALALRDSQLAAYHGVEHKAIAGYEQGKDAAETAKEHDRCGSNLVAPMLISTMAGNRDRALRARRARTRRRSGGHARGCRCFGGDVRLVRAQP